RSYETDRVLSKYFDFGRGLHSLRQYNSDNTYREWLTASYPLDSRLDSAGGELTEELKSLLHTIAVSDSSMIFYMHFPGRYANRMAAFKKFVRYAKSLGIVFVTSSAI